MEYRKNVERILQKVNNSDEGLQMLFYGAFMREMQYAVLEDFEDHGDYYTYNDALPSFIKPRQESLIHKWSEAYDELHERELRDATRRGDVMRYVMQKALTMEKFLEHDNALHGDEWGDEW